MYLKYIEIQGFKSFPDRTKLTFGQEITAIVGPNGSGKSNLSDAVRWVLGEQSGRSLRSRKMEDVIFGGTRMRKAMGFAQVTLCLDNADRRVGDVGDEITVSRRYYRSGESEYLLNGSAVRLRDVREAFLDTGLSRDGYSMIEQGRISEVVSAKSVDRREIFEEASGIAKYRFRKNEAERKLEQAEDNLSRLRDILSELEGRIEPLREQSEKAKQFQQLSAEQKSLEVTLCCDTIERSKRNVHEQEDRIETAKRDYALIERRIGEIDAQFERNHERNVRLIELTNQANREINEIGEEITASERRIATLQSEIAHGEEQVRLLRGDAEASLSAGGEADREMARETGAAEAAAELVLAAEQQIADTERQLLELAEMDAKSDEERRGIAGRLSELSNRLTELRVFVRSAETESGALFERMETVRNALPALRERKEHAAAEERTLLAALRELDGEIAEDENREKGFRIKVSGRSERMEALALELEKKRGEQSETLHRIAALEEMERSMAGYAESVRRVVEASRQRQLRGVIGTVGSLIAIESGCEVAVETALGGNMQNLVVEDERAAKDAIRFLRDSRAGRATFMPVDTVRPAPFDESAALKIEGVIGVAADLVTRDAAFDGIVRSLLGRIIVAEDLDVASEAAKKTQYRYRVVTRDGQVINAGGSYTGGFFSRTAGTFGRRSEIERLRRAEGALKKEMEAARPEYERMKREMTELEAGMTAVSSALINHTTDRVRIESELKYLQSEMASAAAACDAAENELAVSGGRADSLRAERQSAGERLLSVEREIAAMEDTGTAAAAVGSEFAERRAALTERLSEQRVTRMERQKDAERLLENLCQLRRRREDERDRSEQIGLTIAEIEKSGGERAAALSQTAEEVGRLRERTAALRDEADRAAIERMAIEKENNESREKQGGEIKAREEVARELSRLEERKIALQKDYDGAVTKLWEDYGLTRSEAEGMAVPFSSVTALRQSVLQLRGKIRALGSVNVGAIEEYREVGERYAFLKAQVEDVEQSRGQLIALIGRLTAEMRSIFIESFDEINRHFREVFVEMFTGGSANLSLSDEGDVLDSGIEIDVQPPGKVIRSLASLSGGEQSLVAIALYFAILKVNPAPFCVLDEIDSALDEVNVARFAGYLSRLVENTQLIAITHRRGTMEAADVLYGVTMQEEGVSKVLKLTVNEARLAVSN